MLKNKKTGRFIKEPLAVRFLKKIKKTEHGCWEWIGNGTHVGYGRMRDDKKKQRQATHVSWFLEHGEYPQKLMCHKCDSPSCVNPQHLFDGTHKDNAMDAVRKGRTLRGDKNVSAILNEADVFEIKKRLLEKCSLTKLGKEYGVHYSTIGKIKSGDNWRHVTI